MCAVAQEAGGGKGEPGEAGPRQGRAAGEQTKVGGGVGGRLGWRWELVTAKEGLQLDHDEAGR